MTIEPRSNEAEPGEDPERAQLVADRMGRMYDVAAGVTGLAAWARPRRTTGFDTLLSMLTGPNTTDARFVRILLETNNGATLLDQVADLYAARVLSMNTCLRCLCQSGGLLVRGACGEHGQRPMSFGPFDDIVFALAFEEHEDGTPEDVLRALEARFEMREIVPVGEESS